MREKTGQAALIFDSLLEPSLSERSMTLREVTRTIISRVENASGCPVVVSEDASFKTFAVSRIARGANKIHAISFNPSAVSVPDYLICYQCGLNLQLHGATAADQVNRASTADGRQRAHRILSFADRLAEN